MLGAGGHGDPVIGLTQHLQHLIAQVQTKQPLALHEQAHLVFAVGVLGQELLPQDLAIRVVGGHADHIHRGVGAPLLHGGDLLGVGGQNCFLIGIVGQLYPGGPALEQHPPLGQLLADQLAVPGLQRQLRLAGVESLGTGPLGTLGGCRAARGCIAAGGACGGACGGAFAGGGAFA